MSVAPTAGWKDAVAACVRVDFGTGDWAPPRTGRTTAAHRTTGDAAARARLPPEALAAAAGTRAGRTARKTNCEGRWIDDGHESATASPSRIDTMVVAGSGSRRASTCTAPAVRASPWLSAHTTPDLRRPGHPRPGPDTFHGLSAQAGAGSISAARPTRCSWRPPARSPPSRERASSPPDIRSQALPAPAR